MRIKIISDNVKGLKTKFYISLIFPLVSPPCKSPGGGRVVQETSREYFFVSNHPVLCTYKHIKSKAGYHNIYHSMLNWPNVPYDKSTSKFHNLSKVIKTFLVFNTTFHHRIFLQTAKEGEYCWSQPIMLNIKKQLCVHHDREDSQQILNFI